MKILLSAYSCEPGCGSEPGVGWNVAWEIAKHHQVWVITWSPHRSGIETEMTRNPSPNLHFAYYDLPWDQFWWQGYGVQLHYYLWQIGAYFVARRLHSQVSFDLLHHITYVRYWSPSFISLLPVPFIWGPVGGGESTPKAFWSDFSFREKFIETLRNLVHWFGEQDPFVRLTTRRSAVIMATTKETAMRLQTLGAKQVKVLGESGLSQVEINYLGDQSFPSNTSVRFISMGRLLYWKGFHLGLRAFALAKLEGAEYWILGDGPENSRLQALVKELGIVPQVKFWGRLPRDETLHKLEKSHVLVHPSLHDSGGWVCLEAMAAGRPVVCLDLGGPTTQVTEETGFKIPARSPDQAVQDIAKAMVHLAHDSELRVQLGKSGQKRVREMYNWEFKGQFLCQLYEEIIKQP